MEVGIRELKAHLSEYVDKAAKGEVIIVTHRGKSVARLTGLTGMSMIEQGIREGWITAASRAGGLRPVKRFKASLSVTEVLEDDRG